ncbi:MAG: Hsp20/alpha crystallin family protein [Sporichthyaceae bacterium]|nr:Hsp20/alpha crystallin family protein [Sporichthyaceae bacterium]
MTIMTGWDLFEDLRDAQDELLRMNTMRAQRMAQLGQRYDRRVSASAWAPAVDISERKDAYVVTVELPGIGADDLEMIFEDGLMTIQGERHLVHDSSEEKVHRIERRYGTFRRSINLPSHVKADAIEASVQDGVLHILVPKAEEVQAKRIQVRVGSTPPVLTAAVESTQDETPS